ncbi:probable serine threonine- kinase PIX13 [Olea europaea subsp. europaea]|uniref:Probable serine threonine- kinase PIX13 n=1 Tax=Olea europaea subsp. europaea TaxID=158383 RepID=A0A8S0QGX4_OLEEU|nr:probable serine threonine- kinase PIX13 [Olea europaea subsp. europaea]
MGNCLGSQPADPNSSSSKPNSSARPSIPGTLGNDSNGGGLSVTSSSAGLSRFSAAASASSEDTCLTGDILPTPNLKIYSFSDLKNATRNFKSDMVLGMGGFGTVFKGWVDEKTLAPAKYGTGMMVAIKKLNSESIQGFEEWQNYNAKISDFGLAKLGPTGGNSHVTTRVMGTYGYAAPEYIATGHLYVQSDVYGFGVVLLEMMTGLRAFDTKRPNGKQKLTDWVKPILSQRRKLKTIMDARIDGQYSSKVLSQVSQLALRCLEDDPRKRPSMKEVVELLEQIEVTKPKNRPVH